MELLGFFLPPLLDILNRKIKDSDVRWVVTVALCSVLGLLLNVLQHNGVYDTSNWLAIAGSIGTSIAAVYGTSQLTYKAAWEDSSVRNTLGLDAKKQ